MATVYPTFPLGSYGPYGRMAPGSSLSHTPRVLRAGFGGGYEQRVRDGINSDVRTLTARFEKLSEEEADVIEAFLVERGGDRPFLCPVPVNKVILFTCPSWTRAFDEIYHETVTATFVECFDL